MVDRNAEQETLEWDVCVQNAQKFVVRKGLNVKPINPQRECN